MAGNDAVIIRQCEQAGEPIPERIANAPQVPDHLFMYWVAFFDLDSTRNHANGPMPISIIDVMAYCGHLELDDYQRESLIYFIRAMDNVHLKRIASKMEKKAKFK